MSVLLQGIMLLKSFKEMAALKYVRTHRHFPQITASQQSTASIVWSFQRQTHFLMLMVATTNSIPLHFASRAEERAYPGMKMTKALQTKLGYATNL